MRDELSQACRSKNSGLQICSFIYDVLDKTHIMLATTLRKHKVCACAFLVYDLYWDKDDELDDIATTKETLSVLVDLIERSGVGALPLLVATHHDRDNAPGRKEMPPSPPTEKQLVETTTKRVQVHFEKLKRAQESAAAVATNLTFPPVPTTTMANDWRPVKQFIVVVCRSEQPNKKIICIIHVTTGTLEDLISS